MNPDNVRVTEGAFRVDHPVLSEQDTPPGGFVPTELSECIVRYQLCMTHQENAR